MINIPPRLLIWIKSNHNMFMVLFSFIMAFLYVTKSPYFHTSATITREAAPPHKLFGPNSLVVDFADGDLHEANYHCLQKDICIIFLYAPWDSESLLAKGHIEDVARIFFTQVAFVAVNCWHREGACNSVYKMSHYPQIIASIIRRNPVTFKGPIFTSRLVSFISHLLNPMTLARSPQNIFALRAAYDNILLAYFNFVEAPFPPGYIEFYSAALHILENENLPPTVFALVTEGDKDIRNQYNLQHNGDIVFLRTANETVFPLLSTNSHSTASDIISFLYTQSALFSIRSLVTQLQPALVKSIRMDLRLRRGPAFIMAIGKDTTPDTADFYAAMVRGLSLSYSTCSGSAPTLPFLDQLYRTTRHRTSPLMSSWRDTCQIWRQKRKQETVSARCCRCHRVPPVCQAVPVGSPVDRVGDMYSYDTNEFSDAIPLDDQFQENPMYSPNDTPIFSHSSQDFNSHCAFLLQENLQCSRQACLLAHQTSWHHGDQIYRELNREAKRLVRELANSVDRDRWAHFLLQESETHPDPMIDTGAIRLLDQACTEMSGSPVSSSTLSSWLIHPYNQLAPFSEVSGRSIPRPEGKSSQHWSPGNLSAMGCSSNRTVHFYTLDAGVYPHLASNLGFRVDPGAPVQVALVDWKNEATYLFNKTRTFENLAEFITNFHQRRLTVHRLSGRSPTTCSSTPRGSDTPGPCLVTRVTADTFTSSVNHSPSHTVMLFFSPRWCGFCDTLSYLFFTAALHFRTITSPLGARGKNSHMPPVFAQIDLSENDLPWQFQPERIPSLVFFPKNRPSDSVSLPLNGSVGLVKIMAWIQWCLELSGGWNQHWPSLDLPCNEQCLANSTHILRKHKRHLIGAADKLNQSLKTDSVHLNELNDIILHSSTSQRWDRMSPLSLSQSLHQKIFMKPLCRNCPLLTFKRHCGVGKKELEMARCEMNRVGQMWSRNRSKADIVYQKLAQTITLLAAVQAKSILSKSSSTSSFSSVTFTEILVKAGPIVPSIVVGN